MNNEGLAEVFEKNSGKEPPTEFDEKQSDGKRSNVENATSTDVEISATDVKKETTFDIFEESHLLVEENDPDEKQSKMEEYLVVESSVEIGTTDLEKETWPTKIDGIEESDTLIEVKDPDDILAMLKKDENITIEHKTPIGLIGDEVSSTNFVEEVQPSRSGKETTTNNVDSNDMVDETTKPSVNRVLSKEGEKLLSEMDELLLEFETLENDGECYSPEVESITSEIIEIVDNKVPDAFDNVHVSKDMSDSEQDEKELFSMIADSVNVGGEGIGFNDLEKETLPTKMDEIEEPHTLVDEKQSDEKQSSMEQYITVESSANVEFGTTDIEKETTLTKIDIFESHPLVEENDLDEKQSKMFTDSVAEENAKVRTIDILESQISTVHDKDDSESNDEMKYEKESKIEDEISSDKVVAEIKNSGEIDIKTSVKNNEVVKTNVIDSEIKPESKDIKIEEAVFSEKDDELETTKDAVFADDEVGQLKSEMNILQKELNDMQEAFDNLKTPPKVKTLYRKFLKTKKQLHTAHEKIDRFESERKSYSNRNTKTYQRNEEEHRKIISSYDAQVKNLNRIIGENEAQIKENIDRNASLQKDYDDQLLALNEIQQKLDYLSVEKEDASWALDDKRVHGAEVLKSHTKQTVHAEDDADEELALVGEYKKEHLNVSNERSKEDSNIKTDYEELVTLQTVMTANHENEINIYEQKIKALNKEISDLQSSEDKMLLEKDTEKRIREEFETRYNEFEKTIEALNEDVNRYKRLNDELDYASRNGEMKIAELTIKLSNISSENDIISVENKALIVSQEQLKNNNSKLQTECDYLIKQITKLNDELDDLKESKKKLNENLTQRDVMTLELENNLKEKNTLLSCQLEDLEEERKKVDELSAQLSEANVNHSNSLVEIDLLKQNAEKIREEYVQLEIKVIQQSQQIKLLDENLNRVKIENEELIEASNILNTHYRESEENNEKLASQLLTLNKEIDENKSVMGKLEREYSERSKENSQLQSEYEDVVIQKRLMVSTLEADLKQSEVKVIELTKQVADHSYQYNKRLSEIEAITKHQKQLKRDYSKLQDKCDNINQQRNMEVAKLKKEINDNISKTNELKVEVANAKKLNLEFLRKNCKLNEILTDKDSSMKELKNNYTNLVKENNILQSNYEDLDSKKQILSDSHQNEMNIIKNELSILKMQLKDVKMYHGKSIDELEVLKRSYQQIKQEYSRLDDEYSVAISQIESLNEDIKRERNENKMVKESLLESQETIRQLETKLLVSKKDIEEKSDAASSQIHLLNVEITALEKDNKKLIELNQSQQNNIFESEKKIKEWTFEMLNLNKDFDKMKIALDCAEKDYETISGKHAILRREYDDLVSQNSLLVSSNQEELHRYESRIADLAAQLSNLNLQHKKSLYDDQQKIDMLEKEQSKLQEKYDQTIHSKTLLDEETLDLKRVIQELEVVNDTLKESFTESENKRQEDLNMYVNMHEWKITDSSSVSVQPSSQIKIDCLNAHNEYRAKHKGTPRVVWSDFLAQEAQKWVEKVAASGKLAHCPAAERKGQGENIAASKGKQMTGRSATDQWYAEIKDFDFNNKVFSHNTGHFSQVIWKGSVEIGAAIATSKDGWNFCVARYSAAGNMKGAFDKNIGDLS